MRESNERRVPHPFVTKVFFLRNKRVGDLLPPIFTRKPDKHLSVLQASGSWEIPVSSETLF